MYEHLDTEFFTGYFHTLFSPSQRVKYSTMKLQKATIFTTLLNLILVLSYSPCAVEATILTYKVGSKEKACFHVWNDKPNKKLGFYFAVRKED